MEMIPDDLYNDPELFEETTGEKWEDSFKYDQWKRCITVSPPNSNESFSFMEQFAENVDNEKLQNRLIYALSHSKPFGNFKNIVENSSLREQWFAFRTQKLEMYVWDTLHSELGN